MEVALVVTATAGMVVETQVVMAVEVMAVYASVVAWVELQLSQTTGERYPRTEVTALVRMQAISISLEVALTVLVTVPSHTVP